MYVDRKVRKEDKVNYFKISIILNFGKLSILHIGTQGLSFQETCILILKG